MNKYIMTDNGRYYDGHYVRQIKRLNDDMLGGFIESEKNLSQEGKSWVSKDCLVYGNATVTDNASIESFSIVYGNTVISGDSRIMCHSQVYGSAKVCGSSIVKNSNVYDYAFINGGRIYNCSKIYNYAKVMDCAIVTEASSVYDYATILQNVRIESSDVCNHAVISGNAHVRKKSLIHDCIICGDAIIAESMIHGKIFIADKVQCDGTAIEGEGQILSNVVIRDGYVYNNHQGGSFINKKRKQHDLPFLTLDNATIF